MYVFSRAIYREIAHEILEDPHAECTHANHERVLRSCEARFKDGTRVSVPAEVTVDPAELKAALARRTPLMAARYADIYDQLIGG